MLRKATPQAAGSVGGMLALLLAGLALLATGTATAAEPDPLTVHFSAYDPNSTGRVDHGPWSEFLAKVTLEAGRSTKRLGHGKAQKYNASNTTYGNTNPSRFENNRIVYHLLGEEEEILVRGYRQGLMLLPERLPLAWMNRAEQLAYWLNLYNATVVEQVMARYPIRDLRKLRRERPGDLWDEKLLEVDGFALSLRDIERKILFPIWQDPLVLYGLYQGSVGGPRLPGRAYTGDNVRELLGRNMREFVNSNRGMLPRGETLRVSRLYEWGAPLFANETALLRHLASHAEPPFADGLESAGRVDHRLYDWHIADLIDGTRYTGQWNQPGGLLTARVTDPGSAATTGILYSLLDRVLATDKSGRGLPPQAIDLMSGIAENNERRFEPRVTIDECRPGTDCLPDTPANEDPPK